MNIAILGGSGKLGLGFVARLLGTTHGVIIGSRDIAKAHQAAQAAGQRAQPMTNEEAAAKCDAAILTIPYSAHRQLIAPLQDRLAGKIVIDATVPLDYENIFRIVTESGRSAAEEAQTAMPKAEVFAAFQTISHRILRRVDHLEDALVAGPPDRKADVLQLIREMNLRPIDTGPLEAARLLERMTALLISINKQNKVKESGLKVTGI
jgi:NADPH-dependent F420 reductase